MKQPAQKKDGGTVYSGNGYAVGSKPNKPSYDKDFSENLENREEKDYDEDNEAEEAEEDPEEEEDPDEEKDFKPKIPTIKNRNYNVYKANQRGGHQQYRNQVGRAGLNKYQPNANYNHRKKAHNKPEVDDDEVIIRHANERARKNQIETDFTRRNSSRANRISRATWLLENSIFENELSKINFVDQCPYRLQLARHNLPGNFNFRYSQQAASTNSRAGETFIQVPNSNVNAQMDEKALKLSLVQFEIVPLLDVGGSLEIELGLNVDFDLSVNNVSVIACIKHGRISSSLHSCLNKLQVNSSNLNEHTQISRAFIPYPKSGHWFVSIVAFCHKNHALPSHGLSHQSRPIGQDYKDCDRPYSSVLLNIRSASCNACPEKRGTCRNQLQNGVVFSYCECRPSYYGFECKERDDNYMDEVQQQLLTELLVLSLSNVLWLPVIIIAFYKSLWVESLIYIFTMSLSAAFHVCSSTSAYSMCLISPSVLEFGCLFISCLCVCVTIISLSDIGLSLKCTLHMLAAIWTALLIHLQFTPFWMYTCSSILFSLIMLTSWVCRYHASDS